MNFIICKLDNINICMILKVNIGDILKFIDTKMQWIIVLYKNQCIENLDPDPPGIGRKNETEVVSFQYSISLQYYEQLADTEKTRY